MAQNTINSHIFCWIYSSNICFEAAADTVGCKVKEEKSINPEVSELSNKKKQLHDEMNSETNITVKKEKRKEKNKVLKLIYKIIEEEEK